jgi:hypothetical protein
LRWAREIVGALDAHAQIGVLDARGRDAVDAAAAALRVAIDGLSAAVKRYRDFLERKRTKLRGALRAGRHWGVDTSAALAVLDAGERAELRAEVRRAVASLHDTVTAMDERLAFLGPAFVASLYPALVDGVIVRDDEDCDDDATLHGR